MIIQGDKSTKVIIAKEERHAYTLLLDHFDFTKV